MLYFVLFCFVLEFFSTQLNCFWRIHVVLRRTYESAVVLKRTFYSSGPEKDVLEVGAVSLFCCCLTPMGEAEAGLAGWLASEEALAVGWFDKRWRVDMGYLV